MFLQFRMNLAKNLKRVISNSIAWTCGYGFTWIIKWPLAQLLTGESSISEGLRKVNQRTANTESLGPLDILKQQVDMLFPSKLLMLLTILLLIGIICYALIKRRRQVKQVLHLILPILFIALYPYMWYMVALEHSEVHYWFTYRNQLVTVLALGLSVLLVYKKSKNQSIMQTKRTKGFR